MFKKLEKFLTYFLAFLTLLFFTYPQVSHAAALTVLSDTMSRVKISESANHDIKFRTPTGMSSGTFTIDFNTAGFSSGSVDYTDIDLQYGSSEAQVNGSCSSSCTQATLAGSAGAGDWGASFSSNTLTFTYPSSGGTALGGNDYVRVLIGTNAASGDQQMSNPGSSGTKTITITLPTDSGKLAVAIVADDQFTISATVDPTITLGLSATSTDFGTLSTSVATASPNITLTVNTNATSGYTISLQDAGDGTANPGLYNTDADYVIGSGDYSYNNSVDLSSVAGYGVQCASADATCTAPYNVSGNNVGGYELTAQTFATFDGPASSHSITITSKAKITGATPAGSYNDTATVIATGNF